MITLWLGSWRVDCVAALQCHTSQFCLFTTIHGNAASPVRTLPMNCIVSVVRGGLGAFQGQKELPETALFAASGDKPLLCLAKKRLRLYKPDWNLLSRGSQPSFGVGLSTPSLLEKTLCCKGSVWAR